MSGHQERYDVLILGGGTGGITVAAQVMDKIRDRGLSVDGRPVTVAIVEPSEKHYYQPLWTLVGGGLFKREESERSEADFIPSGVDWIKDKVASFEPDQNRVTLAGGGTVGYGQLVVALGIEIDWNGIPGLAESVGKPGTGVCSNYGYDTVASTWDNIRDFKGGRAIFTEPVCGVKCGGAPQKIMYLAEDHFRRSGVRDKCEVIFMIGKGVIFGAPHYVPKLTEVCESRGMDVRFNMNLTELRANKKEAVFQNVESKEETTLAYDMIHVTPPMGSPKVIKDSALANADGWVDVDQYTLRHTKYANVFSLGDCSSLPTSKTGAAIRKQAPTVSENVCAAIAGPSAAELPSRYDGYTSCPLVTGYGKLVLAEFDYTKEPTESFPFDQREERYSMFALKAYGLPRMYWHGMLRGRM